MVESDLEALWTVHTRQTRKRSGGLRARLLARVPPRAPAALFDACARYLDVWHGDGSHVITTDRLDTASLRALVADHRACAIHVPRFCPADVADRLSAEAALECTQWKVGGKLVTDMFYAGGSIPREVASRSWPDFRRYFSERDAFVRRQREMSGGSWPVDRLERELNRAWPAGAGLGEWLGQKVRPAIMRVMSGSLDAGLEAPAHGFGFIHVDDSFVLQPLHGRLSANIYLKVPDDGGSLCIWGVNLGRVTSRRDRVRTSLVGTMGAHMFDAAWQMKLRKLLPDPHVIKPQAGDLVVIHSGRPHSVQPMTDGLRVTNQLFVQANGNGPLTLMS